MDIISYQKAKKAQKAIKETQDKLGYGGTEQGLDIRDVYENTNERLTELEKKDPGVVLYNRIGDISKNILINLNKHSLRIGSLLNQKRYRLTDMVVDDFFDDSGIDYEKSVNIHYDREKGLIRQQDPAVPAELVLIAEAFHSMSLFFISGLINMDLSKQIEMNLQEGVFSNTEISSGKVVLQKQDDGFYVLQGVYETEIMDFGEKVTVHQIQMECTVPEGTTLIPSIAFSNDGINFTEYSTNLSGYGQYARLKFEFTSSLKSALRALSLFIREGNGIHQNGTFMLNKEADSVVLKRNIQKYNGFLFDQNKIESYKGIYSTMYRMKRTVNKGWNR